MGDGADVAFFPFSGVWITVSRPLVMVTMSALLEVDVFKKLLPMMVVVCFLIPAAGASAQAKVSKKEAKKLQKPIKVLINAVRYKKDDLGLKQLALDEMSRQLCIKHWAKITAAQKKEFSANLGTLLKLVSFRKSRDLFKHIDAILFDSPRLEKGGKASIRNTIVVHRAYKKKEIQITWILVKQKKKWRILDLQTIGKTTITRLRSEQIEPLIKEGGIKLVLKKMREMMAKAKK